MTVYVDVLIFVNTIVNYLLICVTAAVTHENPKVWRKCLGGFVSALFSLYIFLPPQPVIIELLLRLACSVVTVLISFNKTCVKAFARNLCAFYGASFIYAGAMMGIMLWLKPQGMSISNGIVYFDISALMLITTSFIFYIVISMLRKLTARSSQTATRCNVNIIYGTSLVACQAMIDTGHTLTDLFGNSLIFIIDRATACKLFGELQVTSLIKGELPQAEALVYRYRTIPVKTVSGDSLMPGIRVDKILINLEEKSFTIEKPIAVLSDGKLGDDYSVILPPQAVDY